MPHVSLSATRGAQPSAIHTVKSVETQAHEVRRVKRRLDDLERSNYTEGTSNAFLTGLAYDNGGDDDPDGGAGGSLALATLKKRKTKAEQSTAVRMLLMYRKNLPLLLEESVRSLDVLCEVSL